MKKIRFIDTKTSIASYMVTFDKYKLSYKDFNNWCKYLEKKLSTKDCQTIVLYGKNYLKNLKRDDAGFLFYIEDSCIRLAEGKTKYHLDKYVLSYTSVDTLLDLLNIPNNFKTSSKEDLSI